MKFFKTLIAATLGTLLAVFILVLILSITIASSGGEPEPYVQDNSVLTIRISGELPSKSIENPFDKLLNPSSGPSVSLETLKNNLDKAAADENIKGVLFEIDFVAEGWANLQEAHRAISQFRDSTDKFVYATTNDAGLNEKGYYLATAADSVFSPPQSFFEFDGFYSQVTFYEGLFDKIGIQTEITRSGKYKSAVEPYYRKELSEPSEYQLNQILSDVSRTFLEAVSRQSGRSIDDINALLNGLPHLDAAFGYREGFIDSLLYRGQLDSLINKRIGLADDETYETIEHSRYSKVSDRSAGLETGDAAGTIGVIYASGPILPSMPGGTIFDNQAVITASWFREQLEAVTDDDVDALVIRINSPGGSGSTSDAIWQMIREAREKMPVIVSMGPVAASGGYYIAMAADTIVAEPTTLTGSIGVFATKFNAKQLFNDELGITFDEVMTHEHADWLSPTRGLTPSEEKAFQAYVDSFYDTFITKVAASRGLTKQQVNDVAQGRVWTGMDAKDQHLVDVLGGMDRALSLAAEKAGLESYDTEDYPKPESLFELLMGATETKVRAMLGSPVPGSEQLRQLRRQSALLSKRNLMLLFPYELNIQ